MNLYKQIFFLNNPFFWQVLFIGAKVVSSFIFVGFLYKNLGTSDVVIYGLISLISAVAISMDLSLSTLGIKYSTLAFNSNNEKGELNLDSVGGELRRFYIILFFLFLFISCVIIYFFYLNNVTLINNNYIILLAFHILIAGFILYSNYIDSMIIGIGKMLELRKFQLLAIIIQLCFFLVFKSFLDLLLTFIASQLLYVFLYRFFISKKQVFTYVKNKFVRDEILNSWKKIGLASLVSIFNNRFVYFLIITFVPIKQSSSFIFFSSILGVISLFSQVPVNAIQNKIVLAWSNRNKLFIKKILLFSFIWSLVIFSVFFVFMIYYFDFFILFRPELDGFPYHIILLLFIFYFIENICGFFANLLLSAGENSFYKYFIFNAFVVFLGSSLLMLLDLLNIQFLIILQVLSMITIVLFNLILIFKKSYHAKFVST